MEGLCMSSLLGVLRSHTWLIGDEEVALLLDRDSLPRRQHQRAHSLSFSFCSSSADGGSEDLADPRSPSLDPHLSHISQGKQRKSLCFFCKTLTGACRVCSPDPQLQLVFVSAAYYCTYRLLPGVHVYYGSEPEAELLKTQRAKLFSPLYLLISCDTCFLAASHP